MRGWGGYGDESYGDGDNVENNSGDGVGMGMTGVGTVGDGDKYLSPCSSLICAHCCSVVDHCSQSVMSHVEC